MKKQYQAPIARFENLRLSENVAAYHCWGFDINGSGTLYADRERYNGYTKFHISKFIGTCEIGEKEGRQFMIDGVVGEDKFTLCDLGAKGPFFVGASKCSPS